MTKQQKEEFNKLYEFTPIEDIENNEINIEEIQKEETKYQKKKRKEREKRIKEKQKKEKEQFDFDTETVIGMAQKNKKRQNKIRKSANKKSRNEENIYSQKEDKKQQIKKVSDRNERRRKRRIRIIKRIIKWTMLIAIIAGGITFAMVSPIFNIQEIQVLDNKEISSDTIISLSGLSKGQNIFRFLTNKIEEQIKQEPYIKEAEVKRSFPNKIEITVQERERAFSAEFLNGYAYIDNQGYILQISNDSLGLPILQGISTPEDKIVAGNRLEEGDLQKLETAIQIMNICKSNNLDSKVTSIDITDRNDYSIYMESEKKTIYLGDGKNLGDKMLWVQAILQDNQGIEGEIYVNGDLTQNFKPRFKQKV